MSSVLIIDDDRALCGALSAVLRKVGYEVDEAPDGAKGLNLYSERKYDLVVSDMLLPIKDGVELIVAIRKLNPKAAIIGMSGGGQVSADIYQRFANALGAKSFLNKPFTMPSFIDLVGQEIKRNQA